MKSVLKATMNKPLLDFRHNNPPLVIASKVGDFILHQPVSFASPASKTRVTLPVT